MRDTANRYRKMRRKQYTAIFRHFTYTLIIIACDGNKLRKKSQIHYSALGGVAEYCGESVCVSVYLCVCVFVCMPTSISPEMQVHLYQMTVRVINVRGSIFLCLRCDTLCSSGFTDLFHIFT